MSRLLAKVTTDLVSVPRITFVPCRTKYYNNRPPNPKWRKQRAWKVWKIDLPDFDKMRYDSKNKNPSIEEMRSQYKERGVAPPNPWQEREVYNPCTIGLIEPYQGAEDGKSSSLISSLKNPLASGKDFVKNKRAVGDIRNFEGEDFNLEEFTKVAKDVYVKAHESLAKHEEDDLYQYVTEHCYPAITAGLDYTTIIWKYLGEIEEPEAVQVRVADLMSKANKYAQITMKFHTKQILAIFDRHGRLIYGSPTNVKEVHEYIVFEKYLSNEYGSWRIHDRIKIDGEQKEISLNVPKTFVRQSN